MDRHICIVLIDSSPIRRAAIARSLAAAGIHVSAISEMLPIPDRRIGLVFLIFPSSPLPSSAARAARRHSRSGLPGLLIEGMESEGPALLAQIAHATWDTGGAAAIERRLRATGHTSVEVGQLVEGVCAGSTLGEHMDRLLARHKAVADREMERKIDTADRRRIGGLKVRFLEAIGCADFDAARDATQEFRVMTARIRRRRQEEWTGDIRSAPAVRAEDVLVEEDMPLESAPPMRDRLWLVRDDVDARDGMSLSGGGPIL